MGELEAKARELVVNMRKRYNKAERAGQVELHVSLDDVNVLLVIAEYCFSLLDKMREWKKGE